MRRSLGTDVSGLGLVLALAAVTARAETPAGCFQLVAPAVRLSVFRANGMTGVVGSASECETLVYRAEVTKVQDIGTVCAFSGGSVDLITPDGAVHRVIPTVPCIGGDGSEGCDASLNRMESPPLEYQVRPEDVGPSGFVVAEVRYEGWTLHTTIGGIDGPPVSSPKPVPVVFCADADPCTSDLCDPSKLGAGACSNPINPSGCFLCGDGVVDPGEVCDAGAQNGRPASCCAFDCQQARGEGETCRAARGACDVAETCDGVAGTCPADAKVPAATICRPASGPCDLPETCDGVADECPAVDVLAAETVCRPATDECDVAEQCNGLSPECPPDGKAAVGAPCGAGDGCDGFGMCVDSCGDGVVEGAEECDLPMVPGGAWCTMSCRVVPCGWQSVADALPAVADGRALACSLADPIVASGCDGSTRSVKGAERLRKRAARRLQSLGASGCRRRAAARVVRGLARQLDGASAALPVDGCARDVVGPAFLVWGQLLGELRSHPERVCQGDVQ